MCHHPCMSVFVFFRTALAEAELEYNEKHISQAVTVRYKISPSSIPVNFSIPSDGSLYALIWTTTPWTLPGNKAIAYSEGFDYCLINIGDLSGIYLVAQNLLPKLEALIEKPVKVLKVIPGKKKKKLESSKTKINRYRYNIWLNFF